MDIRASKDFKAWILSKGYLTLISVQGYLANDFAGTQR